jgi:hypothetical protein
MRHILVLAIGLSAATARADEWAVGLRASAEHLTPDGDPDGFDVGGGGVLVRWRFWPHWGLEAALESVRSETLRMDSLLVKIDLHLTPLSAWDAYVFVGAGGGNAYPAHAAEFKQSVVQLGVGLERRWEHLGIGAELAAVGRERKDVDPPAKAGGGQISAVVGWYF